MDRRRCDICGYVAPPDGSCPRCMGQAIMEGHYSAVAPSGDMIRNFSLGIQYYVSGFKFIFAHKRLFKYIAIPLAICFLLFIGFLVAAILGIEPLLDTFLETEWPSWIDWLRKALYVLIYVLLVLLALLVSFVLTLLLSTVINSPFYDFISEKVEEIYLGQSFEEKWSWEYIKRNILTPIKESLKLVLWELGIAILLFVVSIISAGLGTVLFALAGPYLASLTVFDFVMARKIYTLAEKRHYLHGNLAFIMGFGTPAYFAPFLIPFAVVGSTLAYMASRRK